MKTLRKISKFIGFFLLLLLLGLVIWAVIYLNYTVYDVKVEEETFADIRTKGQIDSLAKDLVSQMSLDEKVDQMTGEGTFNVYSKFLTNIFVAKKFPHIHSGRNERLGIPPFVFSDGPRGAVVGKGNTCFPVAIARAASWDISLEARVADVVGMEIRANGANYSGSPCINILRHPGWGRAQESYGEDPFLSGELGKAYTKNLQRHNVMSTPKHFAVNNVENARFYIDATMDERTLREVYLPQFKKVVQEGKAASVMSAYNRFRGEYCGHNKYLLEKILREDWGFEGFVSSDWLWGLREGVKGVRAGMDVEMPVNSVYRNTIQQALNDGNISEKRIDTMVTRILRTKLTYALAKDPMKYTEEVKAAEKNVALAMEVAEKGMVLLKNESLLPLSARGKKIAVIGRIADLENTGDEGSSNVNAPYVVTPYRGIRAFVEKNGGTVSFSDGADLEEAKKKAAEADAVVILAGYTKKDEGEYIVIDPDSQKGLKAEEVSGGRGGDRFELTLSTDDEAMIKALAAANSNTVVAIVAGSAVIMENWKNEVPTILYAWYAGMEGGNALANVLFGKVNPSGKLPFIIPERKSDLPEFDPFAESLEYGYYHGYTLFDKKGSKTAYPFGYGLSYTQFAYDSLRVNTPNAKEVDSLSVSVTISNIGERDGEEIVQAYVGFANSNIDRPVKILRAFKKIPLKKGESKEVELKVATKDLAYYSEGENTWKIEEMVHELYVGSSSASVDLLKTSFLYGNPMGTENIENQ
ncbi:glycosyl hydrolase [Flavobacteriaceae bacterium TP-CH-4]|uniref:Glycosyl hydrolase n=1 Tax=Pelagihabitans pacificus TaxID=2696054 RepID=A0A967AP16_9FLAO|nr:glycoside hydrolase family 3 C-terminal domain-containing protein [Pelagihabitans pacificus]NHF57846.1 glycosyl hydrolase [Pelagihabitans pacificus]